MSWLAFVRWWLPALVILGGLVAWAFDPTLDGLEGAAHIFGAGLAILLINLLVRIGISGDRERDAEEDARTYFDEHGHWPDEEPARPPPAHRASAPHPHVARGAPRHRGSR
jgi:hypothetical protein